MRLQLVSTLLVCLLAAPAGAEVVLRLTTPAPHGSVWHRNLQTMAERWRHLSAGEVSLRVYPGGAGGSETEAVRRLAAGEVDAVQLTSVGLGVACPESQALSMPLLYADREEFDYVREAMTSLLESRLAEDGMMPLGWSDAGWVRFFSSVPASTASEFKALDLYTWRDDAEGLAFWKDGGFRPNGVLDGSLAEALREGHIEAVPMTAVAALVTQAFSSASHMLDLRWAPSLTGILISKAAWERVPPALRGRLAEAALESALDLTSQVRELESESVEIMRQHGLEIGEPAAEALADWRVTAGQLRRSLRGGMVPESAFDLAVDLVDEHRSLSSRDAGSR